MFSDQEAMDAWKRAGAVGHGVAGMKLAMAYAVELVRARGGTMTDTQQAEWHRMVAEDVFLAEVDRHITAQGAEVATLREKVAALEAEKATLQELLRQHQDAYTEKHREALELRAELARLKPSGQVAEDVERLRAILFTSDNVEWVNHDGRKDAERLVSRLATLAQQGQEAMKPVPGLPVMPPDVVAQFPKAAPVDVGPHPSLPPEAFHESKGLDAEEHMPMADGFTPFEHCQRGTCGHDDAKDPGHAERVAERSQAFNEAAAMHPNGHCTCAGEGTCAWCDAAARDDGFADGYDKGAKAQKAACWEAVQAVLREVGDAPGMPWWERIKAAIEGATP